MNSKGIKLFLERYDGRTHFNGIVKTTSFCDAITTLTDIINNPSEKKENEKGLEYSLIESLLEEVNSDLGKAIVDQNLRNMSLGVRGDYIDPKTKATIIEECLIEKFIDMYSSKVSSIWIVPFFEESKRKKMLLDNIDSGNIKASYNDYFENVAYCGVKSRFYETALKIIIGKDYSLSTRESNIIKCEVVDESIKRAIYGERAGWKLVDKDYVFDMDTYIRDTKLQDGKTGLQILDSLLSKGAVYKDNNEIYFEIEKNEIPLGSFIAKVNLMRCTNIDMKSKETIDYIKNQIRS